MTHSSDKSNEMVVSKEISKLESLCRVSNRKAIVVQGGDSVGFLERVVTCSVAKLQEGESCCGALLTPQGKINVDFLIYRHRDGIFIDTHHNHVEELSKNLRMLRMRANVEIAILEEYQIVSSFDRFFLDTIELSNSIVLDDPRFRSQNSSQNDTVRRIFLHKQDKIALDDEKQLSSMGDERYQTVRTAYGIPEIGYDYGSREVFPTDVNLDIYGGIDYNKGCFIGQEVVSRMRRRGTIRKRSLRIEGEGLEKNAEVRSDSLIGFVTSVTGNTGIACVRIDRLVDGQTYYVNSKPISISLPKGFEVQRVER